MAWQWKNTGENPTTGKKAKGILKAQQIPDYSDICDTPALCGIKEKLAHDQQVDDNDKDSRAINE